TAFERANNDEMNLDPHIYWGSRHLLINSDTTIAQDPNIIITQKFDTATRDSDAAIQN
ncbi:hypothetical protein CU097_002264, partial [Rhizopus azygosporus]